jgi:hypothetical protein
MRCLLLFFLFLTLHLAFADRKMRGRRVVDDDDEDTDLLLKEIAEMDFELDDPVEKLVENEEKPLEKEPLDVEKPIVEKPKKWQILGKVFVTANFESSLKKFKKTLKKADLINDKMEWIAEKTTLVLAVSFLN